jgi:hypothetical protein
MKCKDIPDDLFMAAVAATEPMTPGGAPWRHRRDVHRALEAALETEIPAKLFLAKARRLGRRQLLEGCTSCTCRGDYHTPRECHAGRCCYSPDFDWTTHPCWDPSWENDSPFEWDPEAFTKAVAQAARHMPGLSLTPGLGMFDLSAPARLLYPSGYVQPPPPQPVVERVRVTRDIL